MSLIDHCRQLVEAIRQCACTPYRCDTCMSNLEMLDLSLRTMKGTQVK